MQFLSGAATNLNLDTALNALASGGGSTALIAQLVSDLPPRERGVLTSLAWLRAPFSDEHVVRLGGSADLLRDLASRFLVVRATSERYKVHERHVKLRQRVYARVMRRSNFTRTAQLCVCAVLRSWHGPRFVRYSRMRALPHNGLKSPGRVLAIALRMQAGRYSEFFRGRNSAGELVTRRALN